MISRKDIHHLAELARLSVTDEEADAYCNDFTSIFDYINQIESVNVDDVEKVRHRSVNTMRDDVITEDRGSHTEDILDSAPAVERNFIKVQKVL